MITASAFMVLSYSSLVLLLASLTLLLSLRWRALRRPAIRLLVMFGIFAAASGYVWLDLGPRTDLRLETADHPHVYRLPPLVREV